LRVIVVGAGVIGVTTAYELSRRGCRTLLLEARNGVALESSYANGGLLTPGMSDPWNAPGIHRKIAASLLDPHAAMKLWPSAIPSLFWWGLEFLRNSNVTRHAAASRANFVLGKYSIERMRELRIRLGLEYCGASRGTMKVFRDSRSMDASLKLAEQLASLGLRFIVLDRDGAVAAEPALEGIREKLFGALRFPDDESGDAYEFCKALMFAFQRNGGTMNTSFRVTSIAVQRGIAVGVESETGRVLADKVIIAAGNAASDMMHRVGVSLSIKPVKGYTITFDVSHLDGCPILPVIDDALHAAVVPLGTRLRVAGTAEFAGMDFNVRPERIDNLLELLAALYPSISARLDRWSGRVWTGLRPMSADGLPFVGATSVEGLYVNAGHGHLGWTLAAGSAHLLADLIAGEPTAIDPAPYRTFGR
jgi:D-amino-acid dehydrogenase